MISGGKIIIRKAAEQDLDSLISIYKEVFEVHNIFGRSGEEIKKYLRKFLGTTLVSEEDGKIAGGIVIVEKAQGSSWKLISFKHLAVAKSCQGKNIGTALLNEAEKIAGKGKVEIHVGGLESGALIFYKKNGYKKEGELKSHYREGESCFVMGKVLE